MAHKKYKAKHHHWIDGALKTIEHFFDTVEEAIEHAKESDAQVVKVFSPQGEVVHSAVHPEIAKVVPVSTYA